jgi:two-component system, OmpR family, sensor kinase
VRARSLRTRLVATMLLLLAVASAVIAVVTTFTLRQFLVGRLDSDLRAASAIVLRFPGPPPTGPPPAPDGLPALEGRGPRPPDSLLAQLDGGGRVLSATVYTRTGETRQVPPEVYAVLTSLPVGGRPESRPVGALGSYRLLAVSTPSRGVIVTGLSEKNVEDTIGRLRATDIVVTVVTLLGAGLAGAYVVRRELRPLERVAVTAGRVSTLPLDRGEVSLVERVPDVDPNTEVGQVGTALNRMLDHVGSALEARQDSETRLRQFVADASHELRTPLAAIRGYAELSRRNPVPAETEYSLARISSQAERMTTLVEDLLLLARLDAGRPLERAEVDLTRLVVDAVSDAHVSGPEHRWQLALPDEPVTVPGDPARLSQVLANLLANARTHVPPGSTVTVGLTDDHGGIELSVVDDGPGITPDLLPHVFERFARGSSSRSRATGSTTGSTGLGLSIVQAVVAAHGGTVDVTSTPGRTAFTVHLPRAGRPHPVSA